MKVLILILIKFFLISALFIVSNSDLHLKDVDEREIFFSHYSIWLEKVFGQVVEAGGYVIESRWLPEENFTNPSWNPFERSNS